MDRRDFFKGIVLSSSLYLAGPSRAAQTQGSERPKVIDAHCHAGKGINYGKNDPTSAPWTTYNDPRWTLRRAQEAGIDKTIIFPISNTTYQEANEEIASYVRRWPEKFIGFAGTSVNFEVVAMLSPFYKMRAFGHSRCDLQ